MPMDNELKQSEIFSRRMRKSILNILSFLGGAVLLSPLAILHPGHVLNFPLETTLLLLLGGLSGVFVHFWLVQRWESRTREADLLLVVRTVRRIHLLLAESKSRDELLQGICRILVEEGPYCTAWLALVNRAGALVRCAEVGLGEQFFRVRQSMEKGIFPVCAKRALSGKGIVVRDQASRCPSCLLAAQGADRVCYTARISHRNQDYGLLSISTSAVRKHNPEEQLYFGEIARDVGQALYLMELEEQRISTENRFRELVENSLAGILLIQDDAIIYRNPEQKRLFGPLPAQFRANAFAGVHPEDLEKVEAAYGRVSRGEVGTEDLDFRFYQQQKGDGVPVMKWVFCRASRIEYQGRETVLVSMVDITRNRELEQIVRVQDKMSSLGRVAAGIAHEIRNPLSGINIYLDTMAKICARGENLETVGEIIAQVKGASGKIEAVIRRVMDFSKPGHPQLILTDINQPVENALSLCRATLRKHRVELEHDLANALPRCRLDTSLIEQVILNLLTNAAEALRQCEIKRVKVRTAFEQGAVVIRVADSGPGIKEGLRDKVFDPFYTTKSDGTGIGLSLCQRILNDHHGTLSVKESDWGGAEFIVSLAPESERVDGFL